MALSNPTEGTGQGGVAAVMGKFDLRLGVNACGDYLIWKIKCYKKLCKQNLNKWWEFVLVFFPHHILTLFKAKT